MNYKHLEFIFQTYIDRFGFINNAEHDENYKWEIIQQWQSFDVDADDFCAMLAEMCRLSANLIDGP